MKKHIKKHGSTVSLLLLGGFFIVLLAFASSLFFHRSSDPQFLQKVHTPLGVSLPTITLAPTATPSPTLEPTPVYTGYCLNVPVLMYHHTLPQAIAIQKGHSSLNVDNSLFDQQMGYLASHGYTTLFAQDLILALHNKTALPHKSVVVTLDDGYDDVYDYAFPVAKKYGVKLTVMVPTGLLGINNGPNTYYTWSQLKDMVGSGLVSVGNHTWSHYPVGSGNRQKDQYEIGTAQDQLKQYLSLSPIAFAYPYGTNAGVPYIHQELASDGFLGAFSTIGGSYQCDSFLYSLHRTRIGNVAFPAYGIY